MKMKIGILISTIITLMTIIMPPISVLASETPNNFDNDDINYDNIELYDNDSIKVGNDRLTKLNYNHFIVEENDVVFEEVFFMKTNIIKINDMYYDLDEYLLALNNDTYPTTEALEVLNPISIDAIILE